MPQIIAEVTQDDFDRLEAFRKDNTNAEPSADFYGKILLLGMLKYNES